MTALMVPPPAPFLTSNDRLHYRTSAERTKYWRNAARVAAIAAKIPPVCEPVRIVCWIRFPNSIRRDVGNWYPTAKAVVDGLVDAGVLEDDSDLHIIGPDMRRERPNGPPRLTIRIHPIKKDQA